MEGPFSSSVAANRVPIDEPSSRRPALFIIVDTEEEFDWHAPFSRDATHVTHAGELPRLQEVCDAEGMRPIYTMDYPIATDPVAVELLGRFHAEKRAFLGCHLHGWVNPPFEEVVCARNSHQGNLPGSLEHAKLAVLGAAFRDSFGMDARIHKAGRYGFGPNTTRILTDLGYEIDLSASPGFVIADDGPDYLGFPPQPCWLDHRGGLLELPDTGGFIGSLSRWGAQLFPLINTRLGHQLRLHGVLSRLSLLGRLRLSPEGHGFGEMRQLTEHLLGNGLRSFSMSLHSPSVKPGCTPYVTNTAERDALLRTVRQFIRYFRDELNGTFPDPFEHRQALAASS